MKEQGFWNRYKELIKDVVLDYQYQVMLDEKDINIEREREDHTLPEGKSQAITNLKIAAGLEEGEHFGWWFQDTDVYKWIETAAHILENYEDKALQGRVDDVISIIEKAQQDDGYLSTFYQLRAPHLIYKELDRSHELYNAGHLIEAAVAYYKATNQDALLNVAKKFVTHIQAHFGPGKIEGADGHQEIELALIKLYELTSDKQYLDLSRYFIDVRGKNTEFYNDQKRANGEEPVTNLHYLQAYDQPINQTEAHGHAVRMLYMMEAMADLAHYDQDEQMKDTVETLFKDIVEGKMYVTGGVGQTVQGEAFAQKYELPNDTMYCETCAAIGMVNTAQRLFKLEQDDSLIDILERSLYNGMLAGMSQDGQHFFYVNPLEYIADRYSPDKGHVKGQRPEWLGCACCPPNIARTIASIDSYFYTQIDNNLHIHMYGDASFKSDAITVKQDSLFPQTHSSNFEIEVKEDNQILHFRLPAWADNLTIKLDGTSESDRIVLNKGKYTIQIGMDVKPKAIYSNSNIVHNANKVAFQYGPFIYCAETLDQEDSVYKYFVDSKDINTLWVEDELASRHNLQVGALLKTSGEHLYSYEEEDSKDTQILNLIPYYLWANRELSDMMVWLNRK